MRTWYLRPGVRCRRSSLSCAHRFPQTGQWAGGVDRAGAAQPFSARCMLHQSPAQQDQVLDGKTMVLSCITRRWQKSAQVAQPVG